MTCFWYKIPETLGISCDGNLNGVFCYENGDLKPFPHTLPFEFLFGYSWDILLYRKVKVTPGLPLALKGLCGWGQSCSTVALPCRIWLYLEVNSARIQLINRTLNCCPIISWCVGKTKQKHIGISDRIVFSSHSN